MNTLTKSISSLGPNSKRRGLLFSVIALLVSQGISFQTQATETDALPVTESKLISTYNHEVNCAAHEIQEMGSSDIYQRWGVALAKVKDKQKKWQQTKWFKGLRYRSFLKSLGEFRDMTDLLNISFQSRATERSLEVSISWPFTGSLLPANDFLLIHPSLGHLDLEKLGQVTDVSLKVENNVLTLSTSMSPIEYCAKVPLVLQLNNAIFKTKD